MWPFVVKAMFPEVQCRMFGPGILPEITRNSLLMSSGQVGCDRDGAMNDRLDLRLIARKTEDKQPLDDEESAAWNRLNVMVADWA